MARRHLLALRLRRWRGWGGVAGGCGVKWGGVGRRAATRADSGRGEWEDLSTRVVMGECLCTRQFSLYVRLSRGVGPSHVKTRRGHDMAAEGGLGLARALAGACLFAAHSWELLFNCEQILLDKSRLSR